MNDKKHTILCVDDDPDVLEYLRAVLEAEGYNFIRADTAEAGLKTYKQSNPDIVIADLMMESVDAGTQFVKDLKLEGNTAPVFMLSSVGDDLSRQIDPSAIGLAGVFQKPVNKERLLKIISNKLA
ncbi:MAG: response regulator [Planctomycetes bacterium]|jgi:DNA-binding response OmpR family regulator|nr:response regulator [Phycisphaerae bacterium]NBB94131.1 response regulator [Planctomycetota bacterium]